jgi:hypothetical protein
MFSPNPKNDPLLSAIKTVIAENDKHREAVDRANQHFKITDKRQLPHNLHAEYDALLKESNNLSEKITKSTPMGDVISDFEKSDAPQFAGKSKEKRREMAIAAKMSAMKEEIAPTPMPRRADRMPSDTGGYTVAKGDTLWALSKKYNVSVDDIAKASGLANANQLKIGQKLVIPGKTVAPTARAMSQNPVNMNGIARPSNPLTGTSDTNASPNDPVAAAKAKAAQAGAAANALQQQYQDRKTASDVALFRKADSQSLAGIKPSNQMLPNRTSTNPVNANGIAPNPASNPTPDTSSADLNSGVLSNWMKDTDFNQQASYDDRIAQADAQDAARYNRVFGPSTGPTGSMGGLNSALAQFGMNNLAKGKSASGIPMKEELKGNQHKIDANKNNRIDAQDFKMLRKDMTAEEVMKEAIANLREKDSLSEAEQNILMELDVTDTEVMNSDLYKNAVKSLGGKDPRKIQIGQDIEGLGKFEKGDNIFNKVRSTLAAQKASQPATKDKGYDWTGGDTAQKYIPNLSASVASQSNSGISGLSNPRPGVISINGVPIKAGRSEAPAVTAPPVSGVSGSSGYGGNGSITLGAPNHGPNFMRDYSVAKDRGIKR